VKSIQELTGSTDACGVLLKVETEKWFAFPILGIGVAISYLHNGQVCFDNNQGSTQDLWKQCLQGNSLITSEFINTSIQIAHDLFSVNKLSLLFKTLDGVKSIIF